MGICGSYGTGAVKLGIYHFARAETAWDMMEFLLLGRRVFHSSWSEAAVTIFDITVLLGRWKAGMCAWVTGLVHRGRVGMMLWDFDMHTVDRE